MGMGARCHRWCDGMSDPTSTSARQCVLRLPRSGARAGFVGFCGRGVLWVLLRLRSFMFGVEAVATSGIFVALAFAPSVLRLGDAHDVLWQACAANLSRVAAAGDSDGQCQPGSRLLLPAPLASSDLLRAPLVSVLFHFLRLRSAELPLRRASRGPPPPLRLPGQ